jgi:hypothetical protein
MALYKLNGVNFLYGAIMYNTTSSPNKTRAYPFFTSRSNFAVNDLSQNDADNSWLVMPGFKLQVFVDASYGDTLTTYDNTNGFNPKLYNNASSNTSSIKLYFNNAELAEPAQPT